MGLLFGKAIVVARTARGARQVEVARRAGMDASYLAAIENGRRKAPAGTLLRDLLGAIEMSPPEQRKLELIAALDRMVDVLDDNTSHDHPVAIVKKLLGQVAGLGDVELRCLAVVADGLAREHAKRMEDFP